MLFLTCHFHASFFEFTWHVSLLLDTVISTSHLEGKDQIGFGFYLSVVS